MDPNLPTEQTAGMNAQPWAMRLGAGLVAAFVLIVLLALVDREGRPRIEAAHDLGPVTRQR